MFAVGSGLAMLAAAAGASLAELLRARVRALAALVPAPPAPRACATPLREGSSSIDAKIATPALAGRVSRNRSIVRSFARRPWVGRQRYTFAAVRRRRPVE